MAEARRFRLGFDIGGTFTDFVLVDTVTGRTHLNKCLTTPRDPADGVIEGLRPLLAQAGVRGDDLEIAIHATTLITNALIERKGAKTALLATEGFRDVIEIGTEARYDIYDLFIQRPVPLVPRRWRYEARERLDKDGQVLIPLDERGVKRVADRMRREGVEAVAVVYLHSFRNPVHEQRTRAVLNKALPKAVVSLSSEVAPEIREYERMCTTAANAFVQPITRHYVEDLERRLAGLGYRHRMFLMVSSGGITTGEMAKAFPIRMVESGPAAGVLAAAYYSRSMGLESVIALDMGGTTAKIGLVHKDRPTKANVVEVGRVERFRKGSGIPIRVPVVELIEIGAGGGSIARDNKGMIVVGPDSAGADPGPICYGRGGREPTITDANVILGYISPDWFNGGTMRLDKEAAARGIKRMIADPLGVSTEEAAWGIHLVATSNMENALRIVSVERGRDPRRYAMVAFGGAGPLHAARLARSVGIPTVIVPYGAGVGSAMGLLQAEPRIDVTTTRVMQLDAERSGREISSVYKELEAQASHDAKRISPGATPQWSRYAQMRYAGQGFEIHVDLPPGPIDECYGQKAIEAFKQAYLRRHKFLDPEGSVEAVDWTLVATIPSDGNGTAALGRQSSSERPRREKRSAWFPEAGGYTDTTIVNRAALADGAATTGPAIIEDPDCTSVVLPGDVARMSDKGHILIEINSEALQ